MRLFQQGNAAEEDIYRRLMYDPACNSLTEEIACAKQQLENAYTNFQNASDPDLIDCYIYEGNAAWKRYCFLLKQAKNIL